MYWVQSVSVQTVHPMIMETSGLIPVQLLILSQHPLSPAARLPHTPLTEVKQTNKRAPDVNYPPPQKPDWPVDNSARPVIGR